MHSFCINVGSVFTGYVGQISIFYPALPDSELKNTWTNEIRQSKSSTVCYKNYFNMRALLCEEVALDQVGLHNKNSVRSHSGNVQPMFTSTWVVISLDAYLAPYLQLYHHFGIKHFMLLLNQSCIANTMISKSYASLFSK